MTNTTTMNATYRPRNPGHDYYGRGIYLITLVVRGREPLLGSLGSDVKHPEVHLSPLGEAVLHEWGQASARQAQHGNSIVTHASVCMPDHFHGVIEVLQPMEWSLGDVIQGFKAACTSRWQQQQGLPASSSRPISVDCSAPSTPAWLRKKARKHPDEGSLIRNLSKRQRLEYYALTERGRQPLFDDNYDDTVCLDDRHRRAMIAYVDDNPRRAILRRALPDVMRRCLHVQIGGRSYGAFGNLFLLRWARKVQVQCHRRHPTDGTPYETTADYARQREQWLSAVMQGATAIVTPGISRGELLMKNECMERNLPLIHLQKEPIGPYWKPERRRFDACAGGSLLILAPWEIDSLGAVNNVPASSDYSRFHNLNRLAAEICAFDGEARIVRA